MVLAPEAQTKADQQGQSPDEQQGQWFTAQDKVKLMRSTMMFDWTYWTLSSAMSSALDSINPALTRYGRKEPAPVLPLREEPDLLSWLEASGRLVEDEESASSDVSTVEEEELSALMGEKEDYNKDDEQEEGWED